VIAAAHAERILHRVVDGEDVGTLFEPRGNALRARKHWIAYTLRPRGTLVVDQGAVEALQSGKKSLLPIGVLGVRGQFDPGDAVRLVGPNGEEIARGLSRLGSLEAARVAGATRDATTPPDPGDLPPVVVHKDDLVLLD
jgi:glutamate 5-kinase